MRRFEGTAIAILALGLACRGQQDQSANPPPPSAISQPTVGSSDQPVILEPKPVSYPRLDREPGPAVTVDLLIGTNGEVKRVTVIEAPNGVDVGPIKDGLSTWKFRPATRAGVPVEATIRIPVSVPKPAA